MARFFVPKGRAICYNLLYNYRYIIKKDFHFYHATLSI
jgi:hypothetical protein